MPQYRIIAGPELRRVEAALAQVDAAFPAQFKAELRKVAEIPASVARNKVRSLPTPRNAGHTGLRGRVAAGVGVRVNRNAGVRVITSMAEPAERIIPRGFDRPEGWRHPFFGDRERWYRNPGYSWFMESMQNSRDEFERGLTNVIENAAQKIADAGGMRP